MKAMAIEKISDLSKDKEALKAVDIPVPEPSENQVLIHISACGVCRTDIDEIEGRTPPLKFPVIPGHQVIGRVEKSGKSARIFREGDRVGVGWIFRTCGRCKYCLGGNENLCESFMATGRDADGGYAEYMVVDENFAYPVPGVFSDTEAAPLLCAGAIGWRCLRLSGMKNGEILGLYGFGASGHIVIQAAKYLYPDSEIYVFTRSQEEQKLAIRLGASWAGNIPDRSPQPLDAAIDTTPAWFPVICALKNLGRAGRLIINAIRKESKDKNALYGIEYESHLWLEKEIKTVANVSRRDISEFLQTAAKILIKPEVTIYHLHEASKALWDLKQGGLPGAKVLVMR